LKLRLAPKETKFFDMFAEMCTNLQEGAREMQTLLRDMNQHSSSKPGMPVDVQGSVQRIKELEHRGDEMTHAIITRLNQTFITPFDREDIHKLASSIDDVLDYINAACDRILMYRIAEVEPAAAQLAGIIVRQSDALSKAISELGEQKNVIDYCVEVNRLENEADVVARKAIGELFDREHDPISLIKHKELYEVLETATDKAEDAANVVESVVVKGA
jgi:predicted phosphate transport protein (TIGR00153 family)